MTHSFLLPPKWTMMHEWQISREFTSSQPHINPLSMLYAYIYALYMDVVIDTSARHRKCWPGAKPHLLGDPGASLQPSGHRSNLHVVHGGRLSLEWPSKSTCWKCHRWQRGRIPFLPSQAPGMSESRLLPKSDSLGYDMKHDCGEFLSCDARFCLVVATAVVDILRVDCVLLSKQNPFEFPCWSHEQERIGVIRLEKAAQKRHMSRSLPFVGIPSVEVVVLQSVLIRKR